MPVLPDHLGHGLEARPMGDVTDGHRAVLGGPLVRTGNAADAGGPGTAL